ncbi:hypothetical protein [Flavobacterium sp.]
MTAAAVTGPARHPRPASSVPVSYKCSENFKASINLYDLFYRISLRQR